VSARAVRAATVAFSAPMLVPTTISTCSPLSSSSGASLSSTPAS
jgi:hypothetical protein